MQVREAHGLSTPLAALDSAAITSRARPDAKTRVRGIEVAGYAGIWGSTLASAETHWASSCTCDEIVVGRQKVTNLRLPGQYDERLFQQVGLNLQGPYYNWNRWYLPGVGRYLEPDPIALRGGKNGRYGPDWYGYAVANPLKYVDPAGLYYCTYSVSTHTMACVPTDDSHPGTGFFSDQFVSGNNDIPGCQNNSACASFSDIGPAPQGFWSIDPPHWDGEHYRRDLIPVLLPDQNTWVRYGIQIHGCGSLTAPHCSTGCVSTSRDNFDTLNALFDTESNNWLLVTP